MNFGFDHWCFDLEEVAVEVPDSDVAAVQKMLTHNEVRTTGAYFGTRLVSLAEDKRSELLIIYGERADINEIDCRGEIEQSRLESILQDTLRAFTITTDRDGL